MKKVSCHVLFGGWRGDPAQCTYWVPVKGYACGDYLAVPRMRNTQEPDAPATPADWKRIIGEWQVVTYTGWLIWHGFASSGDAMRFAQDLPPIDRPLVMDEYALATPKGDSMRERIKVLLRSTTALGRGRFTYKRPEDGEARNG